jgi:NTP pyrophosphatase (non-canonical NTP hydrolase)
MTINEYQTAALRTAQTEELTHVELVMNAALGLCGESGEVADIVKKFRFQGHDLDFDHIAKELGDIAWYLAVGAYAIGYDLENILQMNVDKLKARYPDGFSTDRSLHRAENDV